MDSTLGRYLLNPGEVSTQPWRSISTQPWLEPSHHGRPGTTCISKRVTVTGTGMLRHEQIVNRDSATLHMWLEQYRKSISFNKIKTRYECIQNPGVLLLHAVGFSKTYIVHVCALGTVSVAETVGSTCLASTSRIS